MEAAEDLLHMALDLDRGREAPVAATFAVLTSNSQG